MWFLFSVITGVSFALNNLLMRHYAKKFNDTWILAFYFSLIGTIVLFPFFLLDNSLSRTSYIWILLLVAGVGITMHNLTKISSYKFLSASIIDILFKTSLVWIMLISLLFFREQITVYDVIGASLVIIAGVLCIDFIYGNELVIKDKRITGGYNWLSLEWNHKGESIRKICEEHNIGLLDTIVVGDNEQDVYKFNVAGRSIAFNTKRDSVKKAADFIIEGNDLREVLRFIE